MKLIELRCLPIETGTEPLSRDEAAPLILQIPGWLMDDQKLSRECKFKDFRTAMDFVNAVAEIADAQDHHPDITISYNKVRLTLTTHKINGLSINDFIMAARIDAIANCGIIGKAA